MLLSSVAFACAVPAMISFTTENRDRPRAVKRAAGTGPSDTSGRKAVTRAAGGADSVTRAGRALEARREGAVTLRRWPPDVARQMSGRRGPTPTGRELGALTSAGHQLQSS